MELCAACSISFTQSFGEGDKIFCLPACERTRAHFIMESYFTWWRPEQKTQTTEKQQQNSKSERNSHTHTQKCSERIIMHIPNSNENCSLFSVLSVGCFQHSVITIVQTISNCTCLPVRACLCVWLCSAAWVHITTTPVARHFPGNSKVRRSHTHIHMNFFIQNTKGKWRQQETEEERDIFPFWEK